MNSCEMCKKNPLHPDKKCCFNCSRSDSNCGVWHSCGKDCPGWDNAVKTNADRFRAMSDEELAAWMAECNAYGENADASQWLPWLKQPLEE